MAKTNYNKERPKRLAVIVSPGTIKVPREEIITGSLMRRVFVKMQEKLERRLLKNLTPKRMAREGFRLSERCPSCGGIYTVKLRSGFIGCSNCKTKFEPR